MSISNPIPPPVSLSLSPFAGPFSDLGRLCRLFSSRPMLAAVQGENRLYGWMAQNSLQLTRFALGIIFLWFGILKFLPTLTAVDKLAEHTLTIITFHMFRPQRCLHVLAAFECVIGAALLSGRFLRLTVALLFLHLAGTFLPLILLSHQTWIHFPFFPTLEGQYIIKNLVLISAAILVGSTVRGGRIIANPEVATRAKRLELATEERALCMAEDRAAGETAISFQQL